MISSVIGGLVKQVLNLIIIAAIIFGGWNYYKAKREGRTFIVSFYNVDGLAKGAGVYAHGVEIGKVISVFPIGNSNRVGVKAMITKKDFPTPRGEIDAEIITNVESGGGQILELNKISVVKNQPQSNKKFNDFINKGKNHVITKEASRLMLDIFQLSKDFGTDIYNMLSSKEASDYRDENLNSLNNAITSLEYGTLKTDVRSGIDKLNERIEKAAKHSEGDAYRKKQAAERYEAIENTVETLGGISNSYR